ncbi:acyl-CoA dehydrogenase family protein [Kineosporia sp. A_224]|uniref:acyl-CoA dehydrogenase family protein n=1 Tax=Kineosporia sp. A_224 TaxID=1962180 RepID=UPI000B4BAAA5|nr:acyl-CoA dehydrogenase family protein [Kineosporia sp. A_224]
MELTPLPEHDDLRAGVRAVCADFPGSYWQGLEPDRYPTAFVAALTAAGYLGALVPEEYGGGGATLTQAAVILEEVAASGANPSACHAQMYVMGTLLRHGSEEQKRRWLPRIASGALRLQAFGVTEPEAGSDTTRITTRAVRVPQGWQIDGGKIWTSRAEHSDLMLLLARTAPRADGADPSARPSDGLSTFLVDLRGTPGIEIRPIATMMNHSTTQVFLDGVVVSEDALVGVEGQGFRQILDGMNAERILIASECLGDGRFLLDRAVAYASQREVFGRPVGANQGVQFPLAHAYAHLRAADLVRLDAARRFDAGLPCGAEANMAKLLASEASFAAANASLDAHGGYGFAVEYDVERKFRETRLYRTAPVSNNLVLAHLGHHVLGLPKSY